MARKLFWLCSIVSLWLPSAAQAIEQAPNFNVTFDGSVPFGLDSNIYRVPQNSTADVRFSPYFKLSALAELAPGLVYSVYANTNFDHYFQYYDSDGNNAAFGTQIKKQWGRLQAGAFYEWNQFYNVDFNQRLGTANDFGVFVRYAYVSPDEKFRIKPSLSATARLDEVLAAQRYLYYLKIDFERELVDHWSVIVTPRLRYYDYLAVQNDRRDLVYSLSGGFRRRINKNLEFTTTVGYETRTSNLPDRNYNDWTVEASLDFSFSLFGDKERPTSDFLRWRTR